MPQAHKELHGGEELPLLCKQWLRCLFVVQTMEPTQNVPFESKAPAPLPLGVCV